VHLLGQVGQAEVRRERPHQADAGGGVEAVEALVQRGGPAGVGPGLPGQVPHLLDQGDEGVALLPAQGVAQLLAEAADVLAQPSPARAGPGPGSARVRVRFSQGPAHGRAP
jgi:hypothetical protein